MLQHALSLPELEKWRISNDELKAFLVASRAAYNAFVNYHNFRHVIDVMQAVFQFLIHIGTLPPFPAGPVISGIRQQPSPIAALLKPFDALTLLITAIGHDVGHPGVNNAFLVSLNAPLAQLYNDKSVLEAFHCAAYSQILRRHWKAAFEDTSMRGLMINSILATDMGVHMKYMSDLGNLQEKLHHNQGTDGWSAQILDEYRILTCALLIKCADISNVVCLQNATRRNFTDKTPGTTIRHCFEVGGQPPARICQPGRNGKRPGHSDDTIRWPARVGECDQAGQITDRFHEYFRPASF